MPGAWDTAIAAPFDVGLLLLLTDGSVLAQNTGTSLWWRLVPDRAGRYAQGEWKPTGSSANAPLYFASAVLRDGTVFVAGGEYSNNASQPSDLCTAELYDPVAETWRKIATPKDWTAIGDAPCCVLPDGRVLLGNIMAGPCAIWDPKAGKWAATDSKLNASSSEETWTLLSDGSVLTADCVGPPASELFVGNGWIANGNAPALVETASSEIGPAILLTDGSVFAIGATGATGRFKPNAMPGQAGTWTPGPGVPPNAANIPQGAKDAPACLLPNGRVLCVVGPVDGVKDNYLGPASFYEFDPYGATTWTALPSPPAAAALAPYNFCFLLLPNGQVLVSNGTASVALFQPDGAPDPAWAPSIQACSASVLQGSIHRLQGMRLNGLSQACSYGDDAAMATNYPIVRLRAAPPSDRVVYCRTANHSTMAVATGRALHDTEFTVPRDIVPGIYYLSVVANGIASPETLLSVQAGKMRGRNRLSGVDAGEAEMFAEEELFYRDLSEVHMLIDFISGRTDKSLAGLKDVCSADCDGNPVTSMSPQDAVEQICRISYPPSGSVAANAQQAAFMLVVKDKLNYLAAPARGLTVAFTSMFAGTSLKFPNRLTTRLRQFRHWWNGTKPEKTSKPFFSASAAYPNLEDQARRFRYFYNWLPWWSLGLLLLIAYTNWDVSVTDTVIQRITGTSKTYAALLDKDPKFAPTANACATPPQEHEADCEQADIDRDELTADRIDLQNLVGGHDWYSWLRPVALSVHLFASTRDPTYTQPQTIEKTAGTSAKPVEIVPVSVTPVQGTTTSPAPQDKTKSVVARPGHDSAASLSPLEILTMAIVASLNGIVIPAAFGGLGTLAGLLRSITTKMRDSILAPRDYGLARVSIFLGMSAGLAVGLFDFSSAGAGTIKITTAGLSFLAGFAAEAFFTFLDSLIARLMPQTPPPAGK
ncbi:MAG TPA: kelch repeat-containing protein [Rhizomicrobium sp.]|jgi:hypothetical protein|nr:kelch repeat-containing protein [Rhizomicrobium sp.]